jgi:hypothetical protein
MANYKRGYPRTSSRGYSYDKWKGKKRGDSGWFWLQHHSRWWDVCFHTRPSRRRARKVTHNVLLGKVDAEAANWPLNKKPHNYYW